jgi:hypothetical protein
MPTTGLLALGAADVINPNSGELLGHVYTVAHERGQLQRWLLFRNPQNELGIRPASEAMATWSLEDWQNNVENLWRPNAYYVWARADVYEHGGTYNGTTWEQIPAAKDLPEPSFPERMGSNFQLDYMEGRLIEILQNDYRGRAYVVRGLAQESSIEYWMLPANYVPAGRTSMAVSIGQTSAANLDAFVDSCQSSWVAGSALLITGCLNYSGEAPPFGP